MAFFAQHASKLIVPLAVGVVAVRNSIYDVPGGYRAVMFDRFSGVKNQVRNQLSNVCKLTSVTGYW